MSSKPATTAFGGRKLRLCYWNAEARVVDAERMSLERHLKRLGEVQLDVVPSLDAPGVFPCDLLIVAAQMLPETEFPKWLEGFRRRIESGGLIWTPALILADVPFDVLSDIWTAVTRENWYFDILAPGHMASLPIRVANLLRIHDHLHEMKRYATALEDVSTRVKELEAYVASMQTGESST